jgi:hypothetical protein
LHHLVVLPTLQEAWRHIFNQDGSAAILEVLETQLPLEVETPGVELAAGGQSEGVLSSAGNLGEFMIILAHNEFLRIIDLKLRNLSLIFIVNKLSDFVHLGNLLLLLPLGRLLVHLLVKLLNTLECTSA